jgi:tetratricopeptide (TPR) repeat protein
MLETIREYALERLNLDPEFSAAVHQAHAAHYANFTHQQWERLSGGQREAALVDLEADLENVRAAWRYWVAQGDFEQLGKFVDSLWLLNDLRGWYHATVDLTSDLLKVLESTPSTPERAQQEIVLLTSLARALLAIKGYTPEVEATYARALELSEAQGAIPQVFPVLRGLASYYAYQGNFAKGAQIGEQILSLAERQGDARMRIEGYFVLGYNLAFSNDLRRGLEYLEQAIAEYDPDQASPRRFRLGNDPGVASNNVSALLLWMLGFPERSLERANKAVALAKRLNHPFSLAYALFHNGVVHLWRHELEFAQARAQAVLDVAEKHGFHVWRAVATCLHGAALSGLGQAEEGLRQTQQGIELYQLLKTPPIFWPLLLFIQAQAYGQAGQPAAGLIVLEEALEIVGPASADPTVSDFWRLKGQLLLALSADRADEAERAFHNALTVAQQGQASMFELRAAISLCRLWRGQGKTEQGRRLLSEAYEKLSEGFATADLKEAQALLTELS